jgi:hypothetical protein
MSRVNKGVLFILLSGNLLVWGNRCAPRADRNFDFPTFRERALETFPESGLVEVEFEPSPMLPEKHAYLEGVGEDSWFSVYLGYYPAPDLTGEQPHDPRLCYRVADFTILQEDFLQLTPPESEVPVFLNRLLVEHQWGPDTDGKAPVSRRIVYFWSHRGGALPTQSPGRLSALWQILGQLFSPRSDLAWVRVESLLGPDRDAESLPADLTPEERDRIYRIMQAAAACMR